MVRRNDEIRSTRSTRWAPSSMALWSPRDHARRDEAGISIGDHRTYGRQGAGSGRVSRTPVDRRSLRRRCVRAPQVDAWKDVDDSARWQGDLPGTCRIRSSPPAITLSSSSRKRCRIIWRSPPRPTMASSWECSTRLSGLRRAVPSGVDPDAGREELLGNFLAVTGKTPNAAGQPALIGY